MNNQPNPGRIPDFRDVTSDPRVAPSPIQPIAPLPSYVPGEAPPMPQPRPSFSIPPVAPAGGVTPIGR